MDWRLLVTLSVLVHVATSAQILALSHYNGRSMFFVFESLMKELVSRGHQVTVVSHFPQKTPIPNYTDISIEGSMPAIFNNISYDRIRNLNNLKGIIKYVFSDEIEKCRAILEHRNIQDLINSTHKYDLIIIQGFGSDCLLGFAHIFNTPVINVMANAFFSWMSDRMGNPDNPAYIPSIFNPYTPNMNFLERLWNTFTLLAMNWEARASVRAVDQLARKHFGQSLPPLWELTKKTNLILVNSHFSMQQARPNVPAVVEVGGLHIRETKQLPEVNTTTALWFCYKFHDVRKVK
jgi:glucuronosyltransferase